MFDLTDKELAKYELVTMIDVIEHWDKDIIKDFLKRIPGKILISTPKEVCFYTKEYYGDKHTHCSQWFYEDFKDFNTKDYSTAQSYILLLENK
jgi:2-polyprenyl-3-methyl-5-hydroxy-6-metoxy-1,4-benzoquinol methylase